MSYEFLCAIWHREFLPSLERSTGSTSFAAISCSWSFNIFSSIILINATFPEKYVHYRKLGKYSGPYPSGRWTGTLRSLPVLLLSASRESTENVLLLLASTRSLTASVARSFLDFAFFGDMRAGSFAALKFCPLPHRLRFARVRGPENLAVFPPAPVANGVGVCANGVSQNTSGGAKLIVYFALCVRFLKGNWGGFMIKEDKRKRISEGCGRSDH